MNLLSKCMVLVGFTGIVGGAQAQGVCDGTGWCGKPSEPSHNADFAGIAYGTPGKGAPQKPLFGYRKRDVNNPGVEEASRAKVQANKDKLAAKHAELQAENAARKEKIAAMRAEGVRVAELKAEEERMQYIYGTVSSGEPAPAAP